MTSLRSRLFQAIALTVALCVGLTVAVGLVLTRRAVDRATLNDVSHQADLIARSQDVKSTISPLTNLPSLQPYFERQHLSYLRSIEALPQWAKDDLARGRAADGSVTLNGDAQFFAARIVSGQPFVLLRPKSVTRSRWTPYVYSLLIAAHRAPRRPRRRRRAQPRPGDRARPGARRGSRRAGDACDCLQRPRVAARPCP
jgi:hypothetical protein